MAVIRPFRGLRYSSQAGPLSNLVAPPYDVISDSEREELAARSEHNVVHLTLPEQNADDRSKFVKYARSSARLNAWRDMGAIAPESAPALYRYTQTFTIPGHPERLTRTALIALIKLEPYEKGIVLPHEQTFPKHKEDRLRILEATRSHLECIFGLFEDDGGYAFRAISGAGAAGKVSVTTEDKVEHILEPITDAETNRILCAQLMDKKVWIADGHHRYETALTFRAQRGEAPSEVAEDYMMMALSSMSDPGLVLLPTHRMVHKMPIKSADLVEAFQRFFNVRRMPNAELLPMLEKLKAPDNRVFGVACPSGVGLLLTVEDPEKAVQWIHTDDSPRLKMLDVSILHHVIFEKVLGLTGLDFFSYTRDPEEALASVTKGEEAAFLMNPPTVEDMRLIALGGEKMPQKSTYYYPKILSGLVLWSLSDFEA